MCYLETLGNCSTKAYLVKDNIYVQLCLKCRSKELPTRPYLVVEGPISLLVRK